MSGYLLTRRVLLAATGPAAIWALHASPAFAQPDWGEQPEIRPTESVAAGDLPHGAHCELGPTVTTVKTAAVLLLPIDRPLWTERSDAGPGWIAATPS